MKQLTFDFGGVPHDWQERIDLFEQTFDIRFSKVQDGFMTALQGRPSLDIMKLDDRVGNYNSSMDDYINEQYGQLTNNLINSLI